jgi:SAM-dependent methyltransferase
MDEPVPATAMPVVIATKAALQEQEYSFPYHHLPQNAGGAWLAGLALTWSPGYLILLEAVVDLVTARKPTAVLDFGCGDGRLLSELQTHDIPTLAGVDVSPRARRFAEAFTDPERVHIYPDLSAVRGAKFDVITASEVLEHLDERAIAAVLPKLSGMIAPHGVFVVTVPSANVPVNPKHYRHYDLPLLQRQLAGTFKLLRVDYTGRSGWRGSMAATVFCNRLFTLRSYRIARALTGWARRLIVRADASNCTNLIAVLAPVTEHTSNR